MKTNTVAALICLLLLKAGLSYAGSISLKETDLYIAKRHTQHFVIELKHPHRAYSTSKVNGGEQSNIKYLVNHQSMEARNHLERAELILNNKPELYHQMIASDLDLDAAQMVLMGTAANMGNLAHSQAAFKDLTVDVFATAGVSGNALRAGDPTSWYQSRQGNRSVDYDGTINIIVLVNQPVSSGAQAKIAMLLTEAKSSALSELAIPSKRSRHLATGTGTDQFVVVSPILMGAFERESASGHLKIGELIGEAVRKAVLDALKWQNRITAESVASVTHALGRFGFSKEFMLGTFNQTLSPKQVNLAKNNFQSINHDPRLVAAAYGYAQLLDRIEYGVFSPLVAQEILKDYAAIAATSIAAKPDSYHYFWKQLSEDGAPIDLFVNALARGWEAKWD